MTVVPFACFSGMGFAVGHGEIILHDAVTKIVDGAFQGVRHGSELYLPESLWYIGIDAFNGAGITGELNLPDNLSYVGSGAFCGTSISGTLTIPEKITSIDKNTFSWTKIEALELPTNLEIIAEEGFRGNSELKTINFPKYLYYIGDNAFNDCPAITSIICEATTPPTLGSDVFAACDMDHLILEVPSSSVNLYKNADGWKEFTYITAYHELACSISSITTLNEGVTRDGIVQAEGSWHIESAPDWCSITPTSGIYSKEEISITINELTSGAGNRSGEIVIKLDDEDYTTTCPVTQYDYAVETDKEIVLQSATIGSGINIFIVGDGYGAEDIYDGSYLNAMSEYIEYMFDIEPYKSYRDYFNISTAVALSPDSGVSTPSTLKELKFNTINSYGSMSCDYDDLEEYVMNTSSTINSGNLKEALIVVIANVEQFSSDTRLSDSSSTISICCISNDSYPYDMRGVIQHEVGGVGFGKLGVESVSHYDFISTCDCPSCNALSTYTWAKENGWFANLSMSNKMTEAPWYHLIFDERYSKYVDLYEGGYNHARGVYRSENKSCMNTYIPYYNTISRQSIVERIMEYSGGTFDFETFVTNDVMENFED